MPSVGFEPTISAGERPQTYVLDRAATGTGIKENSTFSFTSLCTVNRIRKHVIVQVLSVYYLRPHRLQGTTNQFHTITKIAIQGSKFSLKSGIRYGSIYGKLIQLSAEHVHSFVQNLLCSNTK